MLSLSFLYPTVRTCAIVPLMKEHVIYGRAMTKSCIHPSYHTAFRLPFNPPPSPHTRRDPILVEEPQTTHLSPSHEVSFNKTPSESSLEVIKSLTVAPKNLMDVSDPCALPPALPPPCMHRHALIHVRPLAVLKTVMCVAMLSKLCSTEITCRTSLCSNY